MRTERSSNETPPLFCALLLWSGRLVGLIISIRARKHIPGQSPMVTRQDLVLQSHRHILWSLIGVAPLYWHYNRPIIIRTDTGCIHLVYTSITDSMPVNPGLGPDYG